MKFIMPRDRTVASLTGRAIAFKKGVPVHVPPAMHAEVLNLGAQPETELPEDTKPRSREPADPAERTKALMAAFEVIVLRNRREDFTAGGVPHAKALLAELGWPVEARARDLAWEQFQQGKQGAPA